MLGVPLAATALAAKQLYCPQSPAMRAFAVFLLVCACASAQDHHHAPDAETTVDLAKLPKPESMEGIGHSHIAVTTKSPEAQRWFDQGLALLHCFWDYEALRA